MGFFTNKVKSVIKQKIASNLISGFQNAAFGQPKKLAAKLASKSPLDMSQSPVAHMGQMANPYNYGVATYPQETTNLGDGHYIIFDVIESNKTSYISGETFSGSNISGLEPEQEIKIKTKTGEKYFNILIP